MDYQEIKESLRKALENPGALTADDKAHVRNVCKELGVYFDPKNARCKSCYQDAAVKCVVECNKRLGDERKTNEYLEFAVVTGCLRIPYVLLRKVSTVNFS